MVFRILLFILLFAPLATQAQFMPNQSAVNIVTSPRAPEPNQTISVSLDAYSINTSGATIVWFVDGVENTSARNNRSFQLTTKAIGQETVIAVRLTLRDGVTLTEQIVVVPSRIDIVIEAETLVPGFYQGRPLPSNGSVIRAIAIPHTGTQINAQNLTYLWRLDNQVLFGGPITGKNVAKFTAGFGRDEIVSVDVLDETGQVVGRKSIGIELHKPEILFYVENPLRGIIPNALQSPFALVGEEVTLRAEPYYMDAAILSKQPILEWKMNNSKIANPSNDPQSVTLRKTGDTGEARINFHIRNVQQLVQGAQESIEVQF